MKTTLIILAVLLVALAGYAYYRNPTGCAKLVADMSAIPSSGMGSLRTDAGPVVASLWSTPLPPEPISGLIEGHLVSADGTAYSVPTRSIQHYAIYYSAAWCPPCHAFTPVLVDWYKKFKPAHPDFELIFVSDDHDAASMQAYMKDMAMPWPGFAFGDLPQDGKGIAKFQGNGIPDLVLVDADGKVLSDSFDSSGTYLGPQQVLADIEKILGPGTPPPPAPPTTATPLATATLAALPKAWAPPDVTPAQPNWTWTTSDGTTYNRVVVTKIEPDTVSITHSLGVAHIPINLLPPEIQKQLNYDPHALSQISALLAGKLVSADGTAASAPAAPVQYYAIYYSAQWCPPCHAFTPHLVKWYNAFKPTHPNFELIFVSEDHDDASMLAYMKEMAMPWPAVRFSELKHDGGFKGSGIEKFAGNGIPDLVLVDAGGKVLSDSFQNGTYVGPQTVVDDINRLIGGASPVPLALQ